MNGIDDVVPVNEAHRKRLERLKANLEKLHKRHDQETVAMRVEAEMNKDRFENTKELAQLRIALNGEIQDTLFESQGEQSGFIFRIAKKARAV